MESRTWIVRPHGLGGWLAFIGGLLVAAALLSLIAWNIWRLAEGKVTPNELACVDPTDPCNWSAYRVHNDTPTPVVLRECQHHCGKGDNLLDPVSVTPGRTTGSDVYGVSATVGARDWWQVQSPAGAVLGCLVLDGHPHKRDGDLVDVSAATPCREDAASTPSFASVDR